MNTPTAHAVTRGELLYTGSVKKVYAVVERADAVIFEFSDRISVFDKRIPSAVPRKGEVICRLAAFWFGRCAEAGIRTHFLAQLSPTELLVERVEIERDYARITPERRSVLVPCEFIARHYVAGSFLDRFKHQGYLHGQRLPSPYCETSTKVERTDRLIDRAEALAITKLSPDDLDAIWSVCLQIDTLIETQALRGGLIHADGKKEFGRDANGELMVVDVLGTPDEDRWWDAAAHARGEVVELSKEFVRQHYRSTGYKDALYGARARGEAEPDIPPMPAELVERCSALYIDLYERLTGEKLP
jgi:phosphoribosylaminoimidazole-succinocarboxamide synthase